MEKNNFIYYKEIANLLDKNTFYGFTAKRENNRIRYTFRSVRYPNVLISVLTLKLDPSDVMSKKIVLGIKFNENEVNGFKDFVIELENLSKNYKKKYGNFKKN